MTTETEDRRQFDREKIRPLKIGIVQFSGCSFCCMEATDALNYRMKVPTEIVMSPWNYEIEDHHVKQDYPEMDICFVEGAIGSDEDAEEITAIREKTRFLVGMGTCAISEKMNISMMKNAFSSLKAKLPEDVVEIDRIIKGCKAKDKSIYGAIIELLGEFEDEYYQHLSKTEKP